MCIFSIRAQTGIAGGYATKSNARRREKTFNRLKFWDTPKEVLFQRDLAPDYQPPGERLDSLIIDHITDDRDAPF